MRLSELVAVLSQATDLAMGQPMEFAMGSCLLAVRLGDAMGLPETDLRRVYYQSLLRYIGCNAESTLLASVVGDEMALRKNFALIDSGKPGEVLSLMFRSIRKANAGAPAWQAARMVAKGMLTLPRVQQSFASHCEVAQRLAARLDFDATLIETLGQLYERWDGKGLPKGLRGDKINLSTLIVSVAQDALLFHRLGGPSAALEVLKKRRGAAYAPHVVDAFIKRAERLLAGLDKDQPWDVIVGVEPGGATHLNETEFDGALAVIADFTDLKSPYTLGRSPAVSELAEAAAAKAGLPKEDIILVRRAALVQDLGRVGVSSTIWEKKGPLSDREWESVRLHPYHTERLLAKSPSLAPLGRMASLHHERLDGSGYHRSYRAVGLPTAARILAASDVYQALLEARPHREPFSAAEAAQELQREAKEGRLDREAVLAVLAAAGHKVRGEVRKTVGGLTDRETDVLRLLARGLSMRVIADKLCIAPKTVDNHVQHIYGKIGVSTRAGAALYAAERNLLRPESRQPRE